MADGTIIQQGSFTSTGVDVVLVLRSGVDWVETMNMTAASGATQYVAPISRWQRGMAAGECFYEYHNAASTVLSAGVCSVGPAANPGAIPGFTLIDSTVQTPGAPVTITAIAANGVVSTATTTGLVANSSVVRINNAVGAAQLGGTDYLVTAVNPGVSFTLGTAIAAGNIAAALAPGASAAYQIVPFDPIFYPRRRVITNITRAANAVVTTSVPHGLTVGQMVRINIPVVPGQAATMSQINGLLGEVTATATATTFAVNIDSTAFTAFTYPVTGNAPFTPPYVTPVGEGEDATIADPNLLDDGTLNTAFIGIKLGAGLGSPAGQNADVIYWKAGKSFNV